MLFEGKFEKLSRLCWLDYSSETLSRSEVQEFTIIRSNSGTSVNQRSYIRCSNNARSTVSINSWPAASDPEKHCYVMKLNSMVGLPATFSNDLPPIRLITREIVYRWVKLPKFTEFTICHPYSGDILISIENHFH